MPKPLATRMCVFSPFVMFPNSSHSDFVHLEGILVGPGLHGMLHSGLKFEWPKTPIRKRKSFQDPPYACRIFTGLGSEGVSGWGV